jgi:serine/threonine-protein kinase RsbT
LSQSFSPTLARTLLMVARTRAQCPEGRLSATSVQAVLVALEQCLPAYLADAGRRHACVSALKRAVGERSAEPLSTAVRVVPVKADPDLHTVGEIAKGFASQVGMSLLNQTKLMTASAELARNILLYAGSGEFRFWVIQAPRQGVGVTASDHGPGIADVAKVMTPSYISRTGMGVGLQGAKRLVDEFEISSSPGKGTTVTLRKYV